VQTFGSCAVCCCWVLISAPKDSFSAIFAIIPSTNQLDVHFEQLDPFKDANLPRSSTVGARTPWGFH
jgi:hypothetical protein